jgi:hypothetical protein
MTPGESHISTGSLGVTASRRAEREYVPSHRHSLEHPTLDATLSTLDSEVADWGAVFERIRARNQQRWGEDRHEIAARVGNELHTDRADLVGEVIQNAEDAGATAAGFDFRDDGLLLWNNGHPFRPDELASICGLWDSHKSFAEAGYFGIGFKVVLSVSNEPVLWSGKLACRLAKGLDPEPLTATPDFVQRHLDAGRTCVWLPWRKSVLPEAFYKDAKTRLEDAAADSLAFMRSLERIELRKGTSVHGYGATRKALSESIVTTLVYDDANAQAPREWLVFSEEHSVPQEVMTRLADRAAEQSQRAADRLRSEKAPRVPLQIAFPLDGDELSTAEGRVFARIPTKEKTQLPFHINSRFPTNLARDAVRWGDPLAEWIAATYRAVAENAIPQLLTLGFRGARLVRCLPRKSGLAAAPQSIANAYRTKLLSTAFLVNEAGEATGIEEVRLAHNQRLYSLLPDSELGQAIGKGVHWPHSTLREAPYSEALRDLGCKELEAPIALARLTMKEGLGERARAKDWNWFEAFYQYLDDIGTKAEKVLTDSNIVPIRNGGLVKMAVAVLPPDNRSPPPPDLVQYLEELPLVPNDLARSEAAGKILRKNRASTFAVSLVFQALFEQSDLASGADAAKHQRHVTLLYESWQRQEIDRKFLAELGSELLILDDAGHQQKPSTCYLPTVLGGAAQLPSYLRLAGNRPLLAASYQQIAKQDEKTPLALRDFFQAIGVARLPRATLVATATGQNAINRATGAGIALAGVNGSDWKFHDWKIEGFDEALAAASRIETPNDERMALWQLLSELASDKSVLEAKMTFNATYYRQRGNAWSQLESRQGIPQWLAKARASPWLPATSGHLHLSTDLTAESEAAVLGPGPNYLSQAWLASDAEKALAENLGIRLKADMAGTVGYLRTLGTKPARKETWAPIFAHLAKLTKDDADATAWLSERLRTEALAPCLDGKWRPVTSACWQDPLQIVAQVADDHPPAGLKGLLVERLDLPSSPTISQYSFALQERAQRQAAPDSKTSKKLYQAIWSQADGGEHPAFLDLIVRPCWIARGIDGLGFTYASHIIYNDHAHKALLFRGLLHDLPFDGLNELARAAGMVPASTARPVVVQSGSPHHEEAATKRLQGLWPFISSFAETDEASPVVLLANSVQVAYELAVGGKTVRSMLDDTTKSLSTPGGLLVDEAFAGSDLPDLVGDALEAKFATGANLREFTKDVWQASPASLERVLAIWERRLGRPIRPGAPSEDASEAWEPDTGAVSPTEKTGVETDEPIALVATSSDSESAPDGEQEQVRHRTSTSWSGRQSETAATAAASPNNSIHPEQHWSAPISVEDLEPVILAYESQQRDPVGMPPAASAVTTPSSSSPAPTEFYGGWAPYYPEARFTEVSRRAVGRWGERYVYKALCRQFALEISCVETPIERGVQFIKGERTVTIHWLNMHEEAGIGHDIVVQDAGQVLYYEVKSTVGHHGAAFLMTAKEWELATQARERYTLARVSRAGTAEAQCHMIPDPVGKATSPTEGFRRVQPTIEP